MYKAQLQIFSCIKWQAKQRLKCYSKLNNEIKLIIKKTFVEELRVRGIKQHHLLQLQLRYCGTWKVIKSSCVYPFYESSSVCCRLTSNCVVWGSSISQIIKSSSNTFHLHQTFLNLFFLHKKQRQKRYWVSSFSLISVKHDMCGVTRPLTPSARMLSLGQVEHTPNTKFWIASMN